MKGKKYQIFLQIGINVFIAKLKWYTSLIIELLPLFRRQITNVKL